ncbi:MAG: thioredoxin domain-containing protein, partial [Patescibacteria group bacterium]
MDANPEKRTRPALEKYSTPVSVLLGALIIGGALYFGNGKSATEGAVPEAPNQAAIQKALENITPVSSADHIRGNPNAEVVIVEYSDTECPFCERFPDTMTQVMNEYDASGKVGW